MLKQKDTEALLSHSFSKLARNRKSIKLLMRCYGDKNSSGENRSFDNHPNRIISMEKPISFSKLNLSSMEEIRIDRNKRFEQRGIEKRNKSLE